MKYDDLVSFLLDNKFKYLRNIPSKDLVSFKIGGMADFVVHPHTKSHFIMLIKFLEENVIKYVVIGNGTNTYFSDHGFDGVIVTTKYLNKVFADGIYLVSECGADIKICANKALECGLTGLEFTYGIPGNVGGCVYMNASAFDMNMSNVVFKTTVYDTVSDKILELSLDEHKYFTKHSVFMEENKYIILESVFKLQYGDRIQISDKMESNITKRMRTQPLEFPSAGSVFKRPMNAYASKLIDDAGLKGLSVGDAVVSNIHAGFIINAGSATASDVLKLIEIIKNRINLLYGISLEEEIIYIE